MIDPARPVRLARSNPLTAGILRAYRPPADRESAASATDAVSSGRLERLTGTSAMVAAPVTITPSFTVAAAVRSAGTGTRSVVVQDGGSLSDLSFYLRVGTNSGLTAGTGTYREVGSPSLSAGQPARLALVYGRGLLRYYLDGDLYASASASGTPSVTTGAFTVGRLGSTDDQYFAGPIDHACVWGRALTDAEVAEWSADPDALYAPPRTRTIVLLGGAGGGGEDPAQGTADPAAIAFGGVAAGVPVAIGVADPGGIALGSAASGAGLAASTAAGAIAIGSAGAGSPIVSGSADPGAIAFDSAVSGAGLATSAAVGAIAFGSALAGHALPIGPADAAAITFGSFATAGEPAVQGTADPGAIVFGSSASGGVVAVGGADASAIVLGSSGSGLAVAGGAADAAAIALGASAAGLPVAIGSASGPIAFGSTALAAGLPGSTAIGPVVFGAFATAGEVPDPIVPPTRFASIAARVGPDPATSIAARVGPDPTTSTATGD